MWFVRINACFITGLLLLLALSAQNVKSKICDGGHSCSGPTDCCSKGCCYTGAPMLAVGNGGSGVTGSGLPPGGSAITPSGNVKIMSGAQLLLVPVHWYFWALLFACLLAAICACALWRRRAVWGCCRSDPSGIDRRSEPDSNGSCYAPPHYSRCSSFHHAPPPYTEVASKPDMYPLVISYTVGCDANKTPTASYLMVQYFRNYIFQPTGTLSATSTIDSLSSSFICNAANEANSMVPPPYSCTGSLDEFTISIHQDSSPLHVTESVQEEQQVDSELLQSTSNILIQHNPIQSVNISQNGSAKCQNNVTSSMNNVTLLQSSILDNNINSLNNGQCSSNRADQRVKNQSTNSLENSTHVSWCRMRKATLLNDSSEDSEVCNNIESPVNLSLCVTGSITNCDISSMQLGTPTNHLTDFSSHMEYDTQQNLDELQRTYSVANSITSSDISSLANLGTPDSPPRATSPTVELRELLDKIQQLPQQKSPSNDAPVTSSCGLSRTKRYFPKSKAKTLYMPLNKKSSKPAGIFGGTKSWLSRSAPTTPCTNFTPVFPSRNSAQTSRRGSETTDGSLLLLEQDGSDEEQHEE